MADGAQNGHDPTRLDRIERILETLVTVIADMQQEHRHLLAAQVVLTDRVDRLAAAQQHTEERLSALITVVDELIRRRDPGTPPA